MQSSDIPSRIPVPFANAGIRNEIPTESTSVAGQASLQAGFPPETMTPITSGGIPPSGADFNGILNLVSSGVRWAQAGGTYPFDSDFAASIGGYPRGALLNSSADGVLWLCLIDHNITDPDSPASSGWLNIFDSEAVQQAVVEAQAFAAASAADADRAGREADRAEAAADDALDSASVAAQYTGATRYATYAQMMADASKPDGVKAEVWNDPDVAKRGFYNRSSGTWLFADPQPASAAELNKRVIELSGVEGLIPVAVASGRAVIWMEQGLLSALGVSPRLSEQIFDGKLEMLQPGVITPMAVANGRVVAWFDADGAFAVAKISASLTTAIRSGILAAVDPRTTPTGADAPIATDGRSLFRARARLGTLKSGSAGKLKVAVAGDSWAAQVKIPLAIGAELQGGGIQKGGQGWISTLPGDQLPGSVMARTGWSSETVLGDNPVAPTYGVGADGANIYTAGTVATLTVTTQCTEFRIFYRNHVGTFRYAVDGGAPVEVVASSAGTFGTVLISGLSDASHTISIDTQTNAGTVVLTGFYATRTTSGYELLKMGIGSAAANNIRLIAPYAQDYAEAMLPDLLVVILGTNDYRRSNGSVPIFRQAITELVIAYRAAVPDLGVVLVAPAISSGTAVTPLIQFRTAMYELAMANGWEFLNLYNAVGPYAQANALGQWEDTLHLSDAGARHCAGLFNTKLLGA